MRDPLAPPTSIVYTVDRWSPGIYQAYWGALIGALQGMPVSVTSYWRDSAVNHAVGGLPDSQHLIGLGIDLVPAGGRMSEAASVLQARGLSVVSFPSHLHIQAWPAGVARQSGLLDALGF